MTDFLRVFKIIEVVDPEQVGPLKVQINSYYRIPNPDPHPILGEEVGGNKRCLMLDDDAYDFDQQGLWRCPRCAYAMRRVCMCVRFVVFFVIQCLCGNQTIIKSTRTISSISHTILMRLCSLY